MKYSDYFKDLSAGSKKQTEIVINGYTDTLPATLIRGRENGKSILITTGMHSGEYPGIPATLTAAERIDPEKVSGRIMMIHCLNPSGFRERTDNYVPEDGKNMNRIFPSDNTGTPADRIVSFVSKELLPETDFVLDLHSGGQSERLTDHLYFPAEGQAADHAQREHDDPLPSVQTGKNKQQCLRRNERQKQQYRQKQRTSDAEHQRIRDAHQKQAAAVIRAGPEHAGQKGP